VQTLMIEHASDARSSHCWVAPTIPLSSFIVDYAPCWEDFRINGGALLNDDALGRLGIGLNQMNLDDQKIFQGGLGFDATDGAGSSWRVYDTWAEEPIEANRSPLNVTLAGRDYTLSFEGGAKLIAGLQEVFSFWGTLNLTAAGAETPATILLGSTSADGLYSTDKPALALDKSLDWTQCACPTSGVMYQEVTLEISEVRVDLDKLTKDDDGSDDPEIDIPVNGVVTAMAEITAAGCGAWTTAWTPGEGQVEVSQDALRESVQDACNAGSLQGERCSAFKAAVDELSGPVTLTVSEDKLQEALQESVAIDFDNVICNL
jgi:hypothetical protein